MAYVWSIPPTALKSKHIISYVTLSLSQGPFLFCGTRDKDDIRSLKRKIDKKLGHDIFCE